MKYFLYAKWIQGLIVVLHLSAVTALIADYGFTLDKPVQTAILVLYIFVLIKGVFYTVLKYTYHR